LSPFEQQTVSTVKAINLEEVARNLEIHCYGKALTAGDNMASGGSNSMKGKRRLDEAPQEAGPSVPSGSSQTTNPGETMNVD